MSRGRRRARLARALPISTSVAVTLVVVGLAGLVAVRMGPWSMQPWGYLSFAIAGVGAVSAVLLAIVRLKQVS